MKHRWRLLDDGITDAHHHFAVEEALVRLVDEDRSPPTLRLRQVRRAVFVGIHQDAWAEVDIDYCRTHDIKIVRRGNAGGAVYHDLGSFCYSAVFPRSTLSHSEAELYRLFSEPIIRTCADYGLNARFHGVNDVLVGERKIYGSAQIAWYSAFVQSGTMLVNMDFDVMDRALTPPDVKFADKPARSLKERVTSLARELGHPVDVDEVKAQLAAHLSEVVGVELVPGELTPQERDLAANLMTIKYGTDAWNLGRPRAHGVTVSAKARSGVISLSVDIEGNMIREGRIRGDFLLSDHSLIDDLEEALQGCRMKEAQRVVRRAGLPRQTRDTLEQLISEVFQEEA